jgi:DNA-binding beta-propeller fold protein YncE
MKALLSVIVAFCLPATAGLLVSRGVTGVDLYTNSGVFVSNLIAPGTGGLSDAQGVAVLPNGDILVGDFNNENILRFDRLGAYLGVFANVPDVDNPFDVVLGPDGKVYVANAGGTNTIAQFDAISGALLSASFTSGNPQPIGAPQYIEFGPTLAVTDIAGRLFRFNPGTGVWISTFFFDNPEGVAYDKAGNLYVAQRISDNVLRLPAGGGPAEVVIDTGAFDGAPADLEFGPDGLLYLSANKIYRFDVSGAKGTLIDSFGTGGEFMVFFTEVPEPSSAGLIGFGCALLAFGYRARIF